jgi:hypothetical protein
MRRAVVLTAACLALVSSNARADGPIMELQTEALTPGLVLEESRRPVHQVRLLVEGDGKHGTLILDPNVPEFDEFGGLIGGVQTPQARGKGGGLPTVQLGCAIEFVKAGEDKWLLFRLKGEEITSALLIATRGPILGAGPARLLVLGGDKKVRTVIAMTRYGLAVP